MGHHGRPSEGLRSRGGPGLEFSPVAPGVASLAGKKSKGRKREINRMGIKGGLGRARIGILEGC